MEIEIEIEFYDAEAPKASSSDTSSGKESVGDSESPKSNGLPSWCEPFEGKSTIPAGLVWCTCDLTVEECRVHICNLLMENSNKEREENKPVIILTPDYLRWSCCPPGYLRSLHIGIWNSSLSKLVAFLAAIPTRVRLTEERARMAWIRFPAVQNDFRDRIPRSIIRSELLSKIRSENIRLLLDEKQTPGPGAMSFPHWERPLNSRKLISIGYFRGTAMSFGELVGFYELPLLPDVRGFKVMTASHVEVLTSLLNACFQEFKFTREFNEAEVKHLFLPTANLVHSYVYVGPDENITGFFSFVILRELLKGVEFTAAFSFYSFTVGTPMQQLMRDAMAVALENHCDLFVTCDVKSIRDFLFELRFRQIGAYSQYDFYLDGIGDISKDGIDLILL